MPANDLFLIKGKIEETEKAIKGCLKSYAEYRKSPGFYWHTTNLKILSGEGTKKKQSYLLPSLEAVSMYLKYCETPDAGTIDSYISSKLLLEDIVDIVTEAKKGFSFDPYIPLPIKNVNFVETAGRFLSFASALFKNTYIKNTLEGHSKEAINDLNIITLKAISFLEEAVNNPSGFNFYSWASTNKTKQDRADLTHTYFTLCAITGLIDIIDAKLSALAPNVIENCKKLVKFGLSGLNALYIEDSQEFGDNLTDKASDIITTTFALEALFKAWDYIEIDALRGRARTALLKIYKDLGTDLTGIRAFDRQLKFSYIVEKDTNIVEKDINIVEEEKDTKKFITVLLDDHTTIGSLSNIMCYGLDYLLMTDITDEYYLTLDGIIGKLLERRNPDTKVWKQEEANIWYSTRAIESLIIYITKREIKQITISGRQIVSIISDILKSETVSNAIAKLIRDKIELEIKLKN
ncbi:MAG: hypothetical protein KKD86_15005 [Bacteroidetes bacterium]|nr:hypothetical protein [Bacteroidota bacterium]